jgi:hypothetical protein
MHTWTRSGRGDGTEAVEHSDYRSWSNEQLILERDRKREQLAHLTMNPGPSAEIGRLFVTLDEELDRITDELVGRGLLSYQEALTGPQR